MKMPKLEFELQQEEIKKITNGSLYSDTFCTRYKKFYDNYILVISLK